MTTQCIFRQERAYYSSDQERDRLLSDLSISEAVVFQTATKTALMWRYDASQVLSIPILSRIAAHPDRAIWLQRNDRAEIKLCERVQEGLVRSALSKSAVQRILQAEQTSRYQNSCFIQSDSVISMDTST